MKMTLLEIVQSVLSDMDAEEVNSIGDTTEATQVASIARDTFNNMVANRTIPEHRTLINLTAVGDITKPTHMMYGTNVTKVSTVWYDKSDDDSFQYEEVKWCDPLDFLRMTDGVSGSYVSVDDNGTKLRIRTDAQPSYYTSFDDQYLVFDAYDSAVDATITSGKSRAYGTVLPEFDLNDDNFVPDLDAHMFPYLLAETKSVAFSLLAGGSDPKVEQAARRNKSYLQNDKYNTIRVRKLSHYGRH